MSLNKIDPNMVKSERNINNSTADITSNLDPQVTLILADQSANEETKDLNSATEVDMEQILSERELILPELNKKFPIEPTFDYDTEAFIKDTGLRYNPWSKTILGKSYQELRVKKRDRRQPNFEKSEEFLNWERTGQVRGGLYGVNSSKILFRNYSNL
jgi:hypothetical protein